MADRFQRFTDRALRAMEFAQEEARSFEHNYIGTEHILLGLLREEESVGAKALVNMGVGLEEMRSAVESVIGRGNVAHEGELSLTARAKKAMELTANEARRLNHHYIGTEHILLGLLAEGDGVAAKVLNGSGITLAEAQQEIVRMLGDGPRRGPGRLSGMAPFSWWGERERSVKRYNLALPEELFEQVQSLAERQQTTVVEVLRRFIKLGLLATEVQERRDTALIIREGDREREIILL